MNQLDQIIIDIQNNNLEEALRKILEYEQMAEESSELFNIKGVLALKTMEYDTAIDCLEKAKMLDDKNIDVYYNLAYAYEKKCEFRNAIYAYEQAFSLADNKEEKQQLYHIIQELTNKNGGEVKQTKGLVDDKKIIIKDVSNKQSPNLSDNIYQIRSEKVKLIVDEDTPLVSVVVQAYNNLEKYTKTCIECILKYTNDINYELILIDNGSTDGTLEYFKSVIHPKKKIIHVTKNIGSWYGAYLLYKQNTSKYIVAVANDLFVTKNWLSNMLKCAMSDERIGMVNPVSDYISNLQSVNLEYTDFEDMQVKASEYNVSDPRKWEERLRLITLGTLFKKECLDVIGIGDYGFIHDFADDDITFRVRRAGYKAILCKDVFISHAGKITDKGTHFMVESLEKGRKVFRDKYYGIDAWDDVNNYEIEMINLINCNINYINNNPEILGIDIRCGTPLLEAKNKLRRSEVFNVRLSAFTTNAKYWIDLKTICTGEVVVDRIDYMHEYFKGRKFNYILLGEYLNQYENPYCLIDVMLDKLDDSGHLFIKVVNNYDICTLLTTLGFEVNGRIKNISCIEINFLDEYLGSKGYKIKHISSQYHSFDIDTSNFIKNFLCNLQPIINKENIFSKTMIKEYILDIVKG